MCVFIIKLQVIHSYVFGTCVTGILFYDACRPFLPQPLGWSNLNGFDDALSASRKLDQLTPWNRSATASDTGYSSAWGSNAAGGVDDTSSSDDDDDDDDEGEYDDDSDAEIVAHALKAEDQVDERDVRENIFS